jgi:hypothetical protein
MKFRRGRQVEKQQQQIQVIYIVMINDMAMGAHESNVSAQRHADYLRGTRPENETGSRVWIDSVGLFRDFPNE